MAKEEAGQCIIAVEDELRRLTMRFLFLCLLLVPNFLHILASDLFPRGEIRPDLYEQNLSHIAFHSNAFKLELSSLVASSPSSASIAVVGVEWGSEVLYFAELGYHVYAFEPLSKFVTHLDGILRQNPLLNVTLVPIAAGATRDGGNITLTYDNANVSESVATGVVDDHVHDELAVLSVDVQGEELEVLRGCSRLLAGAKPAVRSLWVEAFSCHEKAFAVLEMLDEGYVVFDFVPWGQSRDEEQVQVPRSAKSFATGGRPGSFRAHWEWMCAMQQNRFRWLQTDFVAVRRDLVTDDFLRRLQSIGTRLCGEGEGKAKCVLREVSADGGSTAKDEL